MNFRLPREHLILFFLVPTLAGAQLYEPSPLEPQNRNPVLQQLAPGEIIGDLMTADEGLSAFWATSFLAPEGSPPEMGDLSGVPEDDRELALSEYAELYDRWTAMYGPRRAMDGDTATAWCEGVEGYGVGEVVTVRVDTTSPVGIWTGFGRSAKDFQANSRPRKVRVWVLQAMGYDVTQTGEFYKDVTALAFRDVELKDVNAWQPLPLPAHKLRDLKNEHYPDGLIPGSMLSLVAVEILSVYPGTRYTDTLISEVANR